MKLKLLPWNNDPFIGWWADSKELTLYHGTHESLLPLIEKSGLKSSGGWISMALDPYTANAYASMTGGEATFRRAGSQARTVPLIERVVLVYKCPMNWVRANMNPHFRGNMDAMRDNLLNRAKYDTAKARGVKDYQYYMATELRFRDVPSAYLQGYTRKSS